MNKKFHTVTVPIHKHQKNILTPQNNGVDRLFHEGLMLHQKGNLVDAEKVYLDVLKSIPKHSDSLHLLGVIHYQKKNYIQALDLINESIQYNSQNAASYSNRGNVLKELKRFDESLESCDHAIRLNPNLVEAYSNRGNVLKELKRFDESLESYDHAIQLNPNYAEAYSNRGNALQELKRFDESLESYDHAIRLNPNLAETFYNRGNVLKELKRFDESLESCDHAIRLNPNLAEAYSNRGFVLQELKRFDESLESYDHAIRLNSNFAAAYRNKSLLLLLRGEYTQGFELYEWRWKQKDLTSPLRNFNQPLWLGEEDLRDKVILIHSEQGLGDTLQFCRYLPMVKARGARVVFEVEDKLIQLLKPIFGYICEFIPKGSPLPEFDLHCPLLSLPLAFKTDLDTISSSPSYLSIDEGRISRWKSKLDQNQFNIGINWQGSQSKIDQGRSFPVTWFEDIAHIPKVRLISLQKGFGTEQLDHLPAGMSVLTLGEEFDSGVDAFLDTAAVMKGLDLVITSDTSVAHLAGALGIPTWVALKWVPDWRWLLDNEDSPWYPNMRLFRQQEMDDWKGVFEQINSELLKLINQIDERTHFKTPQTPMTPISWGELVDKVTILEIKQDRIHNDSAQKNIQKELGYLTQIMTTKNISITIHTLKKDLKAVNEQLWVVEDDIRMKEYQSVFDEEFIQLARSVYQLNDKRAKLKQSINHLLNSELVEEKSYQEFQNINQFNILS